MFLAAFEQFREYEAKQKAIMIGKLPNILQSQPMNFFKYMKNIANDSRKEFTKRT